MSFNTGYNINNSKYYIPEGTPNNFWLGCSSYPITNTCYTSTYHYQNGMQNSFRNDISETPIVRGVCPIGPMAPRGSFRSENS